MTVEIFDATNCILGEGPLWHPSRNQFFWFDIQAKQLLTHADGKLVTRQFDEHVSAAGWVDENTLLVASETGLFRHKISSGENELVAPLEAHNPDTRSNDGRADPWGGFWIGTMGKDGADMAGAIYRFYQGAVTEIIPKQTITNSICFSPDRKVAYYADTRTHRIMRQALEPEDGWLDGAPEVFVDLNDENLNPDGSVVDAAGNVWNAQWGAGRVAKYAPNGSFLSAIEFPAAQTTCPAFGGADLSDLYMTSAATGRDGADDGKTFIVKSAGKGQTEHQVKL